MDAGADERSARWETLFWIAVVLFQMQFACLTAAVTLAGQDAACEQCEQPTPATEGGE